MQVPTYLALNDAQADIDLAKRANAQGEFEIANKHLIAAFDKLVKAFTEELDEEHSE